MNYKLILSPEHNIIVSDEEILENDVYYNQSLNLSGKAKSTTESKKQEHKQNWFKIIAGIPNLPQINYEEFEEQLGIVNVDTIIKKRFNESDGYHKTVYKEAYLKGYKANTKQFTLEDMKQAYLYGNNYHKGSIIEAQNWSLEKLLNDVSQPKVIPIELEMEQIIKTGNIFDGNSVRIGNILSGKFKPKITNSTVKITKLL